MAKIIINQQAIEVKKAGHQHYEIEGNTVLSDLVRINQNEFHLLLNNKSYAITILEKDNAKGNLDLLINGRRISAHLSYKLEELLKSMGMSGRKKLRDIKAPMPGLVLDILVKEGQEVKEGDDLIILEAMKMENALKAPQDGIIGSISIKKQAKVDKNQILISYQ